MKQIIVEQLGVDESEITNLANFVTDFEADWVDKVELISALEEEFDIEIPDDEAAQLTTVGATIDYIISLH